MQMVAHLAWPAVCLGRLAKQGLHQGVALRDQLYLQGGSMGSGTICSQLHPHLLHRLIAANYCFAVRVQDMTIARCICAPDLTTLMDCHM